MTVIDSLPDRPLTDAELAALNRSESVDLAVDATEEAGRARDEVAAVLLATDDWVAALVHDGAWRELERVATDESERFEALQACEAAVRDTLD